MINVFLHQRYFIIRNRTRRFHKFRVPCVLCKTLNKGNAWMKKVLQAQSTTCGTLKEKMPHAACKCVKPNFVMVTNVLKIWIKNVNIYLCWPSRLEPMIYFSFFFLVAAHLPVTRCFALMKKKRSTQY